MTKVPEFWDDVYSNTSAYRSVRAEVHAAHEYFGDLTGKTLVDIGCGPGPATLAFAGMGAGNVIALDVAQKTISELKTYCAEQNIANVTPMCISAINIEDIGPVDFVFGSMILHHLEPFAKFVSGLDRILKPGGRAFFYENNAASRLLVWFRQNLVGKLWVPKHGDAEEFPLTPQEVDILRRYFTVEIEYPEMYFWRLIAIYILRGRLRDEFTTIDNFFYRHKLLLRYSYRQYLRISR